MSFDEAKKMIQKKFPNSIIVRCYESSADYCVQIMSDEARPFVDDRKKEHYVIIGGLYLINKRMGKVTAVPNLMMIPPEIERRISKLKLIYQNEDYPDA